MLHFLPTKVIQKSAKLFQVYRLEAKEIII
jgi:hypothetical protein